MQWFLKLYRELYILGLRIDCEIIGFCWNNFKFYIEVKGCYDNIRRIVILEYLESIVRQGYYLMGVLSKEDICYIYKLCNICNIVEICYFLVIFEEGINVFVVVGF